MLVPAAKNTNPMMTSGIPKVNPIKDTCGIEKTEIIISSGAINFLYTIPHSKFSAILTQGGVDRDILKFGSRKAKKIINSTTSFSKFGRWLPNLQKSDT